jgi:hypothetical protein
MFDADKSFCGRYTGVDGGREATKLSTYTFMKEVRSYESIIALDYRLSQSLTAPHPRYWMD